MKFKNKIWFKCDLLKQFFCILVRERHRFKMKNIENFSAKKFKSSKETSFELDLKKCN